VSYCSRECQRAAWEAHKGECQPLRKLRKEGYALEGQRERPVMEWIVISDPTFDVYAHELSNMDEVLSSNVLIVGDEEGMVKAVGIKRSLPFLEKAKVWEMVLEDTEPASVVISKMHGPVRGV
jgi:hypothetical protein